MFSRHGLYVQGWPQICYGAEDDLEFLIAFCLYFPNFVVMGVFTSYLLYYVCLSKIAC